MSPTANAPTTSRTLGDPDTTRRDDGPRTTSGAYRCEHCKDGLGASRPTREGTLRARVHANPALAQVWRVGVFVAGLLLVALGFALAVLPGPLTIPPVLAGLWVWSTEFAWARRLFDSFKRKAKAAWAHARQHRVSSIAITVGGLLLVAAVVWAVGHFQLVDRMMDWV
jgi:hypothetical protein